jgi:hypothetical protein
MNISKRAAIAAALLATLVVPSFAHADGGGPVSAEIAQLSKRVDELLGSADARELAWGAYLSGSYGLTDRASTLTAVLIASLEDGSADSEHLRVALLDALIRLRAEVDPELLLALFKLGYRAEAIVLLVSAMPRSQSVLLELADGWLDHTEWTAACNMLAETRTPGLAALLLRDVEVSVTVLVTDDVGVGLGEGVGFGCGASYGIGCGASIPQGFPPLTYYDLTPYPERGVTVVAPGRNPVYMSTRNTPRSARVAASKGRASGNSRERLEYLAETLDTYINSIELNDEVSRTIVWSDAASFTSEVSGIRDEVVQAHGALKKRLVAAGLLTKADARAIGPKIEIIIEDRRGDPSEPLPSVPGQSVAGNDEE